MRCCVCLRCPDWSGSVDVETEKLCPLLAISVTQLISARPVLAGSSSSALKSVHASLQHHKCISFFFILIKKKKITHGVEITRVWSKQAGLPVNCLLCVYHAKQEDFWKFYLHILHFCTLLLYLTELSLWKQASRILKHHIPTCMFVMSTASNTVTHCNNKYIYIDCIDRHSIASTQMCKYQV